MMMIKEIWVPDGDDFIAGIVISTYKGNNSQMTKEGLVTVEQLYAVFYEEETGKIHEFPLNETYLKTLQDENRKPKNFGKPKAEK